MNDLKDILSINERFRKLVDSLSTLWTDVLTLKLEGEKSEIARKPESGGTELKVNHTDSTPLPKVVETINYIDVRECKSYSDKSYKMIGYDGRYCHPAKQHIAIIQSLKEGGVRVIFNKTSVWAMNKLEWK